jgi:hypothetical protein
MLWCVENKGKEEKMNTYASRVDQGAKMLDRKVIGWLDKVDFTKLDMNSVMNCVLGQVYGHYDTGLSKLFLNNSQSAVYGFTTSDYGYGSNMSELKQAWVDAFVPKVGKVYKSQDTYPRYTYLRIEKIIGMGDTTIIVALHVKKVADKFEKVEGADYIFRKPSYFRTQYKQFEVEAPKPGQFLVARDGTKFFVGNDSKLWNLSNTNTSWSSHAEVLVDHGTLSPLLTVNGRAFQADFAF